MSKPEKVLKPDGRKKSGAANLVKARAARAANAAKRLEEKLAAAKARLAPVREAQPESADEEEEELVLVPRKKVAEATEMEEPEEPEETEVSDAPPPPKPQKPRKVAKPRKPRKPVLEESTDDTESEITESEPEPPRRRGRQPKEPKPRKPSKEELALQIGRNIALALEEQRHKRSSVRAVEEVKGAGAPAPQPAFSMLRF